MLKQEDNSGKSNYLKPSWRQLQINQIKHLIVLGPSQILPELPGHICRLPPSRHPTKHSTREIRNYVQDHRASNDAANMHYHLRTTEVIWPQCRSIQEKSHSLYTFLPTVIRMVTLVGKIWKTSCLFLVG